MFLLSGWRVGVYDCWSRMRFMTPILSAVGAVDLLSVVVGMAGSGGSWDSLRLDVAMCEDLADHGFEQIVILYPRNGR